MGNICCFDDKQSDKTIIPVQISGTAGLKQNYNLNSSAKQLGEGGFGQVYLTNNKFNKENWVAIKIMNKRKHVNVLDKIYQEVDILSKLDHQNIVKYYETYEDQEETGNIYLVMEYIKGEQLIEALSKKKNSCLSEVDARKYMTQLFKAVAHIHERNIAHRDIKPENIMI